MLSRAHIKQHVDEQLRRAGEAMPPRLRVAFDSLLRQRGLLTPDPAPYFASLGHPLFELPAWVAERLREEDLVIPERTMSDVLGVSVLGYLHTRCQDDWLDGESRADPTLIALAEALIALSNRLLVSVAGVSPRFWTLYQEVMSGYAESVLHTEEIRKNGASVPRSDFQRLLAQSRPLVIPSAALLDRADQLRLLPGLEDFVYSATAASQLYNDLTDVYRDREMGQLTWTVEAFEESGSAPFWDGLLAGEEGGGVLGMRLEEAIGFHERSARAARAIGLVGAEPWLAERRAALEGLAASLRERLVSAFVRRLGAAGEAPKRPTY